MPRWIASGVTPQPPLRICSSTSLALALDECRGRDALHASFVQEVIVLPGITPPTNTMMSSAPCFSGSAMMAGTSVLWPAARCSHPRRARRFQSPGGRILRGLEQRAMSTSKPRSANAVATTLCHGRAVLAQFGNHDPGGGGPGLQQSVDFGLEFFPAFGRVVSSSVHTGHLCVSARWRPKTFSSASDTSPTVARRRMAWMDRSAGCPRPTLLQK